MGFKDYLNMAEDYLGQAGSIGGTVGGILGMLGIGRGKQLRQQRKLNEQAAQINYKYGEMAAENAYERQKEMYNRSYQDQSYAAKTQQMEDAGLSVGLMYGGAGASGGGAGSTTGAPQGATGGAVAGQANNEMDRVQALMAIKQQSMEAKKNAAEVDLLKANAEKARASAQKETEEATTTKDTRELTINKLLEEGRGEWLKNAWDKFKYEQTDEKATAKGWHYLYGDYEFLGTGILGQKQMAELAKDMEEIAKIKADTTAAKSLSALNNERKKAIFQQLLIEARKADAFGVVAEAKRLASEWETGEYTNWKTWATLGLQVTGQITNLIGKKGIGSLFPKEGKTKPQWNELINEVGKENIDKWLK